VATLERSFQILQRIANLGCQRFAFRAIDNVLIITLWKIGASAEALPETNRRHVCCGVVSHKFFDSGQPFSDATCVMFR